LAGSFGSCLSSYPQTLQSDCIITWPASSSLPHWMPAIAVSLLPAFSICSRNRPWRLNTGHFYLIITLVLALCLNFSSFLLKTLTTYCLPEGNCI
jgi:hypothetical protein